MAGAAGLKRSRKWIDVLYVDVHMLYDSIAFNGIAVHVKK